MLKSFKASLSVRQNRSIRPFIHGDCATARWWRMPSQSRANAKIHEVNIASLSVRIARGLL